MGKNIEKLNKLDVKIQKLEKQISSLNSKKTVLEEQRKEISRLAMAEKYQCKPSELNDRIDQEHSLLEKLRASGLSDDELLEKLGQMKDADTTASEIDSEDKSAYFANFKNVNT